MNIQQYINRLFVYAAAVYLTNGRTAMEASDVARELWNDIAHEKDTIAD